MLSAGAWPWRVSADVTATPGWRLSEGVTTALVQGDTVFVGGTFPHLFTPSTSAVQFYDRITAQPRSQCARTTNPAAGLATTPDGVGGLLVSVHADDAFVDENGPFVPPAGTTIVRVASSCLWDRAFAAPAIDPADPDRLDIGLPVRVGNVVYASNAIIGPDLYLQAQVAAFDAASGSRTGFRFYPGIEEIGLLGSSPNGPVVRVRVRGSGGEFVLGVISPSTLQLTTSSTTLADETLDPKFWIRGNTLFRARPAPSHLLEAYDLTTLAPQAGWTSPVVPALADLEVVGNRVFLTSRTVNGNVVAQPSALSAGTGEVDSSWTPPALTLRTPYPSGLPYTPVLTHLATDGVRLYFSGDMERVGGLDRPGTAALLVASASLDVWDPSPALVSPLESTPSGLLMTRPTDTNRITRHYLAAIDVSTGRATAWNPNDPSRPLLRHVVSPVSALAIDGTYLYFASATTGELQRADLATATVDENWRFVVSGSDGRPGRIDMMIESGGTVYLGGEFTFIAGVGVPSTLRRTVAAVGADGALRRWAPALEGPFGVRLLQSILRLGNTIYLAGGFSFVNGQFRPGFAAVDALSHELVQPAIVVPDDTWIRALASDGTRVFVAGESFGAPFIAAAAVPTAAITRFQVRDGHVPSSAAFVAGSLYAGLEYDTDAMSASSRTTRWGRVVAGPGQLLHLTAGDGTLEYYAGQPGPTPGAPSLAGSVSGSIVSLTWASSSSGGVPSSYTLYAGSQPGAADLATLPVQLATSLTTPAPNGGYYIRVVGRNRFGSGPPSNELYLRVGPEPCTSPPNPGTLAFTVAGPDVRFTWTASPTASGYTLEAGAAPGDASLATFPLGNVTAFAATGPPGVYYVRTRARNACGTGAPSNEVVVTLGGPVQVPLPPTDLTATMVGRNVTVRWTPPPSGGLPSGYLLEAGYGPGRSDAAVVQTVVPGLAAANVTPATYYLRVRSLNSAGLGAPTADVVVTVP
jgi:hypothetical protein